VEVLNKDQEPDPDQSWKDVGDEYDGSVIVLCERKLPQNVHLQLSFTLCPAWFCCAYTISNDTPTLHFEGFKVIADGMKDVSTDGDDL